MAATTAIVGTMEGKQLVVYGVVYTQVCISVLRYLVHRKYDRSSCVGDVSYLSIMSPASDGC